MTGIADTADSVFRDYVTDGVPATGAHEPIKSEIRLLFHDIADALGTLGLVGVLAVVYATKAELDADLDHAAGSVAAVTDDGDNTGFYVKVGASGAGSWSGPSAELRGPAGPTGAMGTIIFTSGPPEEADGSDGYYAVDTLTGDWYGPKVAADSPPWPSTGYNSTGAQGDTGPAGSAEDAEKIELLQSGHFTTQTIGVPVPATGTAITNVTRRHGTPFEKAGYIFEVGAFGVNSGGTLKLKILSVSGGTVTVESDTSLTIAAGANALTIGAGLDAPIPFTAGQYWGYHAYQTNGKISSISSSAPVTPFYSIASDQTTTYATASEAFTSNTTAQIYIKVRYGDGYEETLRLAGANGGGETVYWGRSAAVVDTGTDLNTGNTTITWMTVPFQHDGLIEEWHVGSGTAGPMILTLGRLTGEGTIDIYRRVVVTAAIGNNVFTRGVELPDDLIVYKGETLDGYQTQTATGGCITYTNSSSTVETEGYGLSTTITGDTMGVVAIARTSQNRRYERRFRLTVPHHNVSKHHNDVLVDHDFTTGYDPLVDVWAIGTLTYSAAGASIGTAGIGNGLEGTIHEALERSQTWFRVKVDTASDLMLGKKPGGDSIFGSSMLIDVANDRLRFYQMESDTSYTTNNGATGTQFAEIATPFASPMDGTETLLIGMIKDRRDMHWVVMNADTHEMAQLTDSGHEAYTETLAAGYTLSRRLNTWDDETDLGDMGLFAGRWFAATLTGTGAKVERVRILSPDLNAEYMGLGDSMWTSRAAYDSSWWGLIRAALEAAGTKGVLNAVDGTHVGTTRIYTNKLLSRMPYLKGLIYAAGMADVAPSYTEATAEAEIDTTFARAEDLGINKSVTCDVFPHFTTTGTPPTVNEGNSIVTEHLRTVAANYGYDHIYYRISFSTSGAEGTRDAAKFNGAADPHLHPTLGHPFAAKQMALEAPSLGIQLPDIVGKFFTL